MVLFETGCVCVCCVVRIFWQPSFVSSDDADEQVQVWLFGRVRRRATQGERTRARADLQEARPLATQMVQTWLVYSSIFLLAIDVLWSFECGLWTCVSGVFVREGLWLLSITGCASLGNGPDAVRL